MKGSVITMEFTVVRSLVREPISYEKSAYQASLIISGLSIVYLFSVVATGNSWLPYTDINLDSSEWLLCLLQCAAGMAALQLPLVLKKLTGIKLPSMLNVGFYAFLLGSTVLGEVFSLYYRVPCWDDILHFGSGMMIGMIGSVLFMHYCRKKQCQHLISPALIAIASVCFAVFIGVAWEIYEFAGDSLLGLNMQKCLLQDGTALIGNAALADTMKDLIVDLGGALVAAFASYTSLKNKQGWLYTGDFTALRA